MIVDNDHDPIVAFLGLGLISGSLAGALKHRDWRAELIAWGPRAPSLERGLALGLIDRFSLDLSTVVAEADVIVIGAPPEATAQLLPEVLDLAFASGEPVVTDMASIKGVIVEAAGTDYPRFVPGHPIAGSENSGVEAAYPELFFGREVILTPSGDTDASALKTVERLWTTAGARITHMSVADHDAALAASSHVPHMVAYALTSMLADHALSPMQHGGGALRDMTRIAAGHPAIWPDICVQNADPIVDALDELISELSAIRDVVSERDRAALLARLESARVARRNLPTTIPSTEAMSEMRVPVLDRQGELAAIATLAADLDVNIYDLEIAHSAEGPRGVVVLVVETAMTERLQGGLMALGYRPSSRSLEA